jgi:hypothetical protein
MNNPIKNGRNKPKNWGLAFVSNCQAVQALPPQFEIGKKLVQSKEFSFKPVF